MPNFSGYCNFSEHPPPLPRATAKQKKQKKQKNIHMCVCVNSLRKIIKIRVSQQ